MPGRASKRIRRPPPTGKAVRELGAQLRATRLKAGLSMEELGRPYVTRAAVSRIELGLSSPSYKLLVHFSRRLGVSVRELIPNDH